MEIVTLYRITHVTDEFPVIQEVKALKVDGYHFVDFTVKSADGPAEQRSVSSVLSSNSLERPYSGLTNYFTNIVDAEKELKEHVQHFKKYANRKVALLTEQLKSLK